MPYGSPRGNTALNRVEVSSGFLSPSKQLLTVSPRRIMKSHFVVKADENSTETRKEQMREEFAWPPLPVCILFLLWCSSGCARNEIYCFQLPSMKKYQQGNHLLLHSSTLERSTWRLSPKVSWKYLNGVQMTDREPLRTCFVPRFVYRNGWTSFNVASEPTSREAQWRFSRFLFAPRLKSYERAEWWMRKW